MQQIVENIYSGRLSFAERKLLKLPLLKLQGITNLNKSGRRKYTNILVDILDLNKELCTVSSHDESIIQCGIDKMRSQGDLFRIMKYYCPDITFEEFRKTLFELINKGMIGISYCATINKRVVYKPYKGMRVPKYPPYLSGTYVRKDEFGFSMKLINV